MYSIIRNCRLWAAVLVLGSAAPSFAVSIIGGNPIHDEITDITDGAGFTIRVHSLVFRGEANAPNDAVISDLGPDETLFVYLTQNIGSSGDPFMNNFEVTNPAEMELRQIGYSGLLPNATDPARRTNPDIVQSFNSFEGAIYQWQGVQPVAPEYWSLIFFKAEGFWDYVDAYTYNDVTGAFGLGSIPGPAVIPEPASLALLAFGAMGLLRRRARR